MYAVPYANNLTRSLSLVVEMLNYSLFDLVCESPSFTNPRPFLGLRRVGADAAVLHVQAITIAWFIHVGQNHVV